MIVYKDILNYPELYTFHMNIKAPYIKEVDYKEYLTSLFYDVDSYGNKLFKDLFLVGAYEDEELIGFIQFGTTNIGFDSNGKISDKVNYSVIRNLYFEEKEVGEELLKRALILLKKDVFAFFHYFGMSCFCRHGKLSSNLKNIEKLLFEYGFKQNEENIYYSLVLLQQEDNEIFLELEEKNKFNTQVITFKENKSFLGQCEIHYVSKTLAYLRWIYVDESKKHQGYGTKIIKKLINYLLELGIKILETDTAIDNKIAQNYYKKMNFINLENTKSYLKKR